MMNPKTSNLGTLSSCFDPKASSQHEEPHKWLTKWLIGESHDQFQFNNKNEEDWKDRGCICHTTGP